MDEVRGRLTVLALCLALGSCVSALDCLRNPTGCVGEGGGTTTPEPSPTAGPVPSPSPSPKPSADPCGPEGQRCSPPPPPSPRPSPSPTAAPPPSPSPVPSGPPPLTESGNFPVPVGACPPHFKDAVSEVGISVLTRRKCAGKDAPKDCTLTVLNATEKSTRPFCEHSCYDEAGHYALANCRARCETVRACQQPEFVNGNSGIQMLISSPQWGNVFGDCDKQTAEGPFPDTRRNFMCHDRAENRGGETRAKACEPDGSKCGPTISYRSLP